MLDFRSTKREQKVTFHSISVNSYKIAEPKPV